MFFIDNPKIKCVRVEENGEMNNVVNLLKPKYKNNDIFVCGCFKRWLKSKITNKKLLNYKIESNNYNLNYDTINSKNYNFINNFYKDIGLNLTVFYEYFNLPENKLSQYLFNLVKDYRIIFIQLKSSNNKKLNIKNVLDVGCGGGLLSEPMKRLGADVVGIDASEKNIKIAKLHSKKNKLKINYLCSSPEKLKITNKFDVILNMEIVEHVEDIDFFLKSCSKLLKKNGLMFVATINKTLKSYIFAIVGAEYVLRWLPIGTHEWEKFVKPEDLKKILMKYDLSLNKLEGMNFNIIKDEWSISRDLSVNYIAKFIKN